MSGWRASRARDLSLIREDYTKRGLSILGIAQKWKRAGKAISRNTITSWRHDDEAAGNPNWDDLRGENDPPSLWEQREILAWRRAELLRTRGRNLEDGAVINEVKNLNDAIRELDTVLKNPEPIVTALVTLGMFALQESASEAEMAVLRDWIARVRDALRTGTIAVEDFGCH